MIPEAARRRLAIVHLYFEGWNVASTAGYLETTRTRVSDLVRSGRTLIPRASTGRQQIVGTTLAIKPRPAVLLAVAAQGGDRVPPLRILDLRLFFLCILRGTFSS